MYIDTHTHLLNEELNDIKDEIAASLVADGIECIIEAGCDAKRGIGAIELVNKHKNVFCALGMHPQDAKDYTPEYEKWLLENLKHKKVVAVGEIGLDYHYMYSTKEKQIEVFRRQLQISDLPVVVHSRDAEEDTIKILLENPNKKYLIHCFSGSVQMIDRLAPLKPMYAFGGAITFKKADMSAQIKKIGLDNIVLETDCPYLSPEPFRGKVNQPKNVKIVAQKLSEILNISVAQIERKTTANARKFFNIVLK